jgi:hypothetical protein
MRSTSRSRWARAAGRGFALFALALATSGLAAGCGGSEAVGRPCELGTMPLEGVNGQIATATSPALECPITSAFSPAPTGTRARPRR